MSISYENDFKGDVMVEKEINSLENYLKIIFEIKKYLKNKYFNNENLYKSIDEINRIEKELNDNKGEMNFYETEKRVKTFLENYRIYQLNQCNPNVTNYKIDREKKYRIVTSKKELEIFYRGVYNEKFNLLPSCFRKGHYGKESKYYHYIMAKCSSEFNHKNHFDTLVTLQHYDCPTRLLDITTNPLVALYFACKNYGCDICDKTDFGYVYIFVELKSNLLFKDSDRAIMLSCLSKFSKDEQDKIYDECIKRISKDGIMAKFNQGNESRIIEKLYHEIRTEVDFEKKIFVIDLLKNYYVIPDYTNRRIDRQSGAFILTGICENQNDCENKINNEVVLKIKISNKENILEQLDLLGINEATLFPEMDKVAKYYIQNLK